ncbi:MAG: hypothetical protein RLZZ184_1045, partial [Cyanobacteriota bacterium]
MTKKIWILIYTPPSHCEQGVLIFNNLAEERVKLLLLLLLSF